MTDREKAGLRGPVRSVRTLTTSETLTFTADGRLEQRRWDSPDGKNVSVIRYEYDERGRPSRIVSDESGQVTESFAYHADGTATQTRHFGPDFWTPAAGQGCVGFDIPPTDESKLGTLAIGASHYETHLDARGFATETVAVGQNGERLARAVYERDDEGLLIAEWIEAEAAAAAALVAGFPEELRAAAADLALARVFDRRVTYVYDDAGRCVETRRDMGAFGSTLERTRHDEFGNITAVECDSENGHSFLRYAYTYDSHGNWTEQVSYSSAERGSPEQQVGVLERVIDYYGAVQNE